MSTKIGFGALIVLIVLVASARAADNQDPSADRKFRARLSTCSTCHGGNGVPKVVGIPIIWGQDADYLLKQIHDFESGDRDVEIMTYVVKQIEPEFVGGVMANIAKRKWPLTVSGGGAALPPGPPGLAVCKGCHQNNFLGASTPEAKQLAGGPAPRLAGQNYEYLVRQMNRFAEGELRNSPTMAALMAAIPPADRDAMARYLSRL